MVVRWKKLTVVCVEVRKREFYVHVINFQGNSWVGDNVTFINRISWELHDDSQIDFECFNHSCWLIASLFCFSCMVKPYIRRSLPFLHKLYMTSEEEGRAKPSLCLNYRENHTISLPFSVYEPPSTVLLVDSVCLCHSSMQACILNESKDRGRLRVRGGEWRVWTCRENTTETPSWVLPETSLTADSARWHR